MDKKYMNFVIFIGSPDEYGNIFALGYGQTMDLIKYAKDYCIVHPHGYREETMIPTNRIYFPKE